MLLGLMATPRKKGKQDSVDPLLDRLLDDDDLDAHYAAREELEGIKGERREALISAVISALSSGAHIAGIGVLADLGGARAVDALVKLAADEDEEVREEAVMALGNLESRPAAAVPALVAALSDANEDIRDQAADALGEYASPAAIEPLLAALAKAHAEPRWQSDVRVGGILEALAASGPGDGRVIAMLVEHLVPGAPPVAKPAFDALGSLGKKAEAARPALDALTKSDSPWMAIHAHRTLVALGDPPDQHVPAIVDALLVKDQGGVVNSAASALLVDLGAVAKPFVEAAVKGKNAALRKVAERVKTKMASRR
jgi:HEAT repeat protein